MSCVLIRRILISCLWAENVPAILTSVFIDRKCKQVGSSPSLAQKLPDCQGESGAPVQSQRWREFRFVCTGMPAVECSGLSRADGQWPIRAFQLVKSSCTPDALCMLPKYAGGSP